MQPKVVFTSPSLDRLEIARDGVIGVFVFSEKRPLQGLIGKLDWRLGGHLSRLIIEDFYAGAPQETLLFPLGHKLLNSRLLVVGLGHRDDFNRAQYNTALHSLFDTIKGIDAHPVVIALPGRPENVIDPASAMEWCLEVLDQRDDIDTLTVVEPSAVQPLVVPCIERWRLKNSVPLTSPAHYH